MIFKTYNLYRGEDKNIEKIIMDSNLHYMHFTLPHGEGLPEHNANSNVYMTVVRGTLSIRLGTASVPLDTANCLDGGDYAEYGANTLLTIPAGHG